MRNVLIIHHIDMDGYTAAAIATEVYDPYIVNYFTAQYGDGVENAVSYIESEHDKYDLVLVVDLGLTEEQTNRIDNIVNTTDLQVIHIDHHPIQYEPMKWQHITIGKSATLLTAEYFNIEVTEFIRCVNAADVFNKENEDEFEKGRRLTFVLNTLGNYSYQEGLNTATTDSVVTILREFICKDEFSPGEFMDLLDPMKLLIHSGAQKALAEGVTINGVHVIYEFDMNPSDVSDHLFANMNPNFDTMAFVSSRGTCAMRGARAREIALKFGGGGHELAAGFKVDPIESLEEARSLFKDI